VSRGGVGEGVGEGVAVNGKGVGHRAAGVGLSNFMLLLLSFRGSEMSMLGSVCGG
jgi:hypothetical protein